MSEKGAHEETNQNSDHARDDKITLHRLEQCLATVRAATHLQQRIIGKHRDQALRRHVLCKHAIDGEGEHVDALLLDLTAIGRCGPYDNVTDAQQSAVEQPPRRSVSWSRTSVAGRGPT